jgi:hypothetical protein
MGRLHGQPRHERRRFSVKWERQLSTFPADVHRLAADLITIYLLFPANIRPETKQRDLQQVLAWKLSEDTPDLTAVNEASSSGVGNAGTLYLTAKPWQLGFYLRFAEAAITGKVDPTDPDASRRLADAVMREVGRCQPARNILLHLLFPDRFERIASDGHKRKIINAFNQDAGSVEDLDDALLAIREALKGRLNRAELDFYDRDLRPLWLPETDTEEPKSQPTAQRYWVEKTIVTGRPDRQAGPHALGQALWSPQKSVGNQDIYWQMRDVQPGDVVFHLVDNRALVGVSIAAAKADDTFVGPEGTEWAGRPGYRVPLRDLVSLSPEIDRQAFLDASEHRDLLETLLRRHKNLFFNTELNLNQGAYLTEAPLELVELWQKVFRAKGGALLPHVSSARTTQTWIFQGSPKSFDVRGAVRALTEVDWTATSKRDEIGPGDRVYLWESGQDAGIVAVAEVMDRPSQRPLRETERPFIHDSRFEDADIRVALRIRQVVEPILSRARLRDDTRLSNLSIFRQAQGTNFRVSPQEAQAIEELLSRGPHRPSEKAYARLLTSIAKTGLHFPVELISNYLLALQTKRFVILTGISGTGKTQLALAVAEHFGANAGGQNRVLLAVRPDWTDNRGLSDTSARSQGSTRTRRYSSCFAVPLRR